VRRAPLYIAPARPPPMSSSDGPLFELHLVRSYLPLFLLAWRACATVAVTRLLPAVLDDTPVFACLCFLAYFDAHAFRKDTLNRAVGFMLPAAFVGYTNLRGRQAWAEVDVECARLYMLAPYWAADVLWAASSSMLVAAVAFRVTVSLRVHAVAVLWAGLALCHVMLGCLRVLAWWEVLARVIWYYLSASVFFLCSLVLTGVDRNTHSFTAMHVNLHVLFVESYVLLGSVLVSLGVYAYLYWGSVAAAPSSRPAGPGPPPPELARRPGPTTGSQDDLLAQLRAAKAGAV